MALPSTPDTSGFNHFGESPPNDLAVATTIQGAADDPSILAMKESDRPAAIANLQKTLAGLAGSDRSVQEWQNLSPASVIPPGTGYEQQRDILVKSIEQATKGIPGASELVAGAKQQLAGVATAPPEFGSIEARDRDLGVAPRGTLTKAPYAFNPGTAPDAEQPNFSQPNFSQPVLGGASLPTIDPRYAFTPNAPRQLPSPVGPSSFPQPPRKF